ncbi:MAG: UbiD family decarboxylase [Bacteroidetes bacterium]|jgi:4-hydroxy-3-polyprenylbenzoate decarboxylase|nr:UbiD family decarboxylase [Bacteroidota bacterium]
MVYTSMQECLDDLEKNGHLVRIKEEVDPELEMAAIHLRVHEAGGKAVLFEKVKGTKYPCVSNIFGTTERTHFIFREHFGMMQQLIEVKNNPMAFIKKPFRNISLAFAAYKALPKRIRAKAKDHFEEIRIDQLPLIKHWEKDGGAFVTLPQVYTEDADQPGIMQSNLGMYRIQLNGNKYVLNEEIGLHYQLHRGIGVHQTKAKSKGQPLKVSIFVGGPPSHTLAAVMPLPEGLSEMTFAGALNGRRFRYFYEDGFCISADADFVITGEVYPDENKPEGPFGDHLGYYSLTHDFPLMRVHKVYAKKNAIWAFTVVGRPPQEDTGFGNFIHEMTGEGLKKEIPGVKEVHAVDAAGVHPLLLAVGSERYTPYLQNKQPAELLTIANHILGKGQLSLAKFLFITADDANKVTVKNIEDYFSFVLKRIDWKRDIHFYTNTTIDTLDYSGTGLNTGSKVVFAAYGDVKRELSRRVPSYFEETGTFTKARMAMPGVVVLTAKAFTDYETASAETQELNRQLKDHVVELNDTPLIVIADDSDFVAETLNNFLWVTFTRCNPSHDIYGIESYTQFKHWACKGPLIIDARIKPHHAPVLVKNDAVEKRVDAVLQNIAFK